MIYLLLVDSCIYIRPQWDEAAQCNKYSIVALYVDDLIIACSNIHMCKELEREFKKKCQMKILEKIKHILGMDVEINPVTHVVHISQAEYIRKSIRDYSKYGPKVNSNHTRHRWTVGNHFTRLRVQKQEQRKRYECNHYHIVN